MALYQVVCTTQAPSASGSPHSHITHLGFGNGSHRITVPQAIAQLRSPTGDRYYTISPTTGRRADVKEDDCEVCGQHACVRTNADGIRDNNLKALRSC